MPTLHNIPPGAHHRGFVTAAQGYLRNVSNNIAMPWHVVNDIIQNTADTVDVQGGHRPERANFSLGYANGAWPAGLQPAGAPHVPPAAEPHVLVCICNGQAAKGVKWLSMTNGEFATFSAGAGGAVRRQYTRSMR